MKNISNGYITLRVLQNDGLLSVIKSIQYAQAAAQTFNTSITVTVSSVALIKHLQAPYYHLLIIVLTLLDSLQISPFTRQAAGHTQTQNLSL